MASDVSRLETSEQQHLQGPLSRLLIRSDRCSNPDNTGIGPALQILVFFVAAALIVSRRPDALFNPQFFGEDGAVWFPEAYMSGWFTSLLHSRNGYFQTLPRLIAAIALLAPLRLAPLIENLIGITIQVLPVNFLLSAHCRNWAPLFIRTVMAILYIALPNTRELDAAPEEGQWHLALLACILVLACPPASLKSRLTDISLILLSGLSGPFCVILLPITLIYWWFRRERWRLVIAAVLVTSAVIQLSGLLTSAEATRSHAILGASPALLIRLVAGQVYLAAMLGQSNLQVHRDWAVLAVVAFCGTALLAYCFVKARLEWKLLLAFCFLVFAASLKNPMVSMTVPQWQILRDASSGIRYWFFPMVAFVWALAWCATTGGNGFVRFVGGAGLLMACAGITNDWRYPAYTDFHFAKYAAEFASARPGTLVAIPIFPDGWMMRLVKRSPACRTLPSGSVDQPARGARVSGSVLVTGWVIAAEPVRRVSVYVDRTLAQSITPDVRRPDVDSFYPHSPGKYKGWKMLVDTSKITPGSHEIEVQALEADGCEADIAIIPIERTGSNAAAANPTTNRR